MEQAAPVGYLKGGDLHQLPLSESAVEQSPPRTKLLSHTPFLEKPRFRPKGLTNVGNTCYANAVLQCLMSTALTQALMDPEAAPVFRQYSFNLNILQRGSGSVDSDEEGDEEGSNSSEDKLTLKKASNQELADRCQWLTNELKKVTLNYVNVECKLDVEPTMSESISNLFFANEGPVVNPQSITRHPHRISRCLRPYQQEDAHEFLRAMLSTLAMNGRNKELSSLFDGLMESSITCQSCGNPSLTRDRYMDLSLNIADKHIHTLHDALKHFTQSEMLTGDNKVQCDRCNEKCTAKKGLRLATAPSILVCHLKRFAFDPCGGLVRLSKKVKFPTRLDISDYMSNMNQSQPPEYELVAVLVHQGQSCEAGHYVAFVKSEGEWFCCNDKQVTPVPFEKVMRQQAYILMYEVADMRENHGFPSPSGSPKQMDDSTDGSSSYGGPRQPNTLLNSMLCGLDNEVVRSMCFALSPEYGAPSVDTSHEVQCTFQPMCGGMVVGPVREASEEESENDEEDSLIAGDIEDDIEQERDWAKTPLRKSMSSGNIGHLEQQDPRRRGCDFLKTDSGITGHSPTRARKGRSKSLKVHSRSGLPPRPSS
uniref:Ubiquitin carboxyl-terminal hydrolase n=1 Tax=Entomoneis paludosa TaxID=265537 RepID=A0A7S2YG47_9STRA|mmetsp:Transcript_31789/g.66357  ORF Transcript_31789/g.66357 Transcript_31789/m.66357 type:complete len:594 (+) Transcript_31789:358-2139(+)|eukprot:CAMPEP_0172450690 /NCGR_PEP_ID=MMETSP1065-20121228/8938_1 /TAXON_ID=265537 /ORGANISM="Amphiprora paludosa, Strain CCMP125" /LENGTH=593 /DNA_ID=CAMNT_0013202497 /DNA_START=325 /DNA_END=2106 /DNA_ORIENTATION=-